MFCNKHLVVHIIHFDRMNFLWHILYILLHPIKHIMDLNFILLLIEHILMMNLKYNLDSMQYIN